MPREYRLATHTLLKVVGLVVFTIFSVTRFCAISATFVKTKLFKNMTTFGAILLI